jgi:glycerol uptake facilitator-like aquaporin
MEGEHARNLWEAAIFPALSGFVLCTGVVLFAAWRPAARPGPWQPLDRVRTRSLVRHSAALVASGWAVFMLIVLVYSEWLQHEDPGMETARWSGLFLLAIAIPTWVVMTWAADRRARSRGRPSAR